MGDIADYCLESALDDGFYMYVEPEPTRYIRKHIIRVVTETENAWLVETKRGHHHWYPKSVCTLRGKSLSVPDWMKPEHVAPTKLSINTITAHLKNENRTKIN